MADRVARWRTDFQKAQAELKQTQNELQRWELLADQSSAQRGERGFQGSKIRGRLSTLKVELSRLQRELDALSAKHTEHDVTRKSLTQYGDALAKAFEELQRMQLRGKAPPTGSAVSLEAGTFYSIAT